MSFQVNSATAHQAQYPSANTGPDVFASVRANFAEYNQKSLTELLADKDSLGQKLRSAFAALDQQSTSIFSQLQSSSASTPDLSDSLLAIQDPKRTVFETALLQQREKKFLTLEAQKEIQIAAFLQSHPQQLQTLGQLADQRMDSVRKLLAIQDASGTLTTLSATISKESPQWSSIQDQQSQLNTAYNKLDQTRYETEQTLFSQMKELGFTGSLKATQPMQDTLMVQDTQLNQGARVVEWDFQRKMIDVTQQDLHKSLSDVDTQTTQARKTLSQSLGIKQKSLEHKQQATLREMQTQGLLEQFFQRNAADSRVTSLLKVSLERLKLNKQIASLENQVAQYSSAQATLSPQSDERKQLSDKIMMLSTQEDPLIQNSLAHLKVLNQFAKEIEPTAPTFGDPAQQEVDITVLALYNRLSALDPNDSLAVTIQQRIATLLSAGI